VDTRFNVFEVLEIAEEVEHKAARFFLKSAKRFDDWERRNIHYNLASWRAKHQQAWARLRQEYSEKTGQFGTFDPDNYVLSNPQVMAGLTCFGVDAESKARPTGYESKAGIIRDATRRSEGVVIFYRGLKAFVCDPAGRGMIDRMIDEEQRFIRLLRRLLSRVSGPPEGFANPAVISETMVPHRYAMAGPRLS
jgi:rubrerythrin